jgi:glucose/mannose-6-phosphate isomerase
LLNYSDIEKYDPSGMHKVYDDWPKIAKDAYESDLEPANFEGIDHIIFSGMGGSGAMGDLFLSVLSKTSVHVTVVKGYVLPKTVNSQTLVIATSVSGNTVETLSTVESAKNIGCKIICFSSGGKLEQFCKENHIEHRHIPIYGNPRASFPAYVYSILKTLNSLIPVTKSSIEQSINQLTTTCVTISTANLSESNPSLSLANWLDSISVIYYPWGLQAAAIRFKNSIQENMKSHAMIEDVIETCHNGIVSWEKKSEVKPILIQGSEDYIKTKERWQILKDFFTENKIDFWEIKSIEGSILSKIINLIYLLDFASIYRSVINKTDPAPVNSINFIKNHLK